MTEITVRKLDHAGNETWRYQGRLIERGAHHVLLEAYFDRADTDVHGLVLARGDRFVEIYFDNRWYNVFQIHDHAGERLKGWYANIGMPASIADNTISYRDLALDLLVFPDGRQVTVDEKEFAALPISEEARDAARQALFELKQRFEIKPVDIRIWEAG